MRIVPYLNFDNVLHNLGSPLGLFPGSTLCVYCNGDAKVHIDHSLDNLVIACSACRTAYSLFELFIKQAGITDAFDADELAQYINDHKLLRIRATADLILGHFDRISSFDHLRCTLDKLHRAARPLFPKLTYSLAKLWGHKELDETHWDAIKDHFFPILTADLLEIVEQIPGHLIQDKLVAVIPFYSSPYVVCGILVTGLKSSLYFTPIPFLGEAGVGGDPNVFAYRQFHKLLDGYSFYVRNPSIYMMLITSILCASGVVPHVALIYKGFAHVKHARKGIETLNLPAAGKVPIMIDRLTRHSVRLILESGGSFFPIKDAIQIKNPVQYLINAIARSHNSAFLISYIKGDNRLGMVKDTLAILALEEQQKSINAIKSYSTIETKVEALSNYELIVAGKKARITNAGVYVEGKQVSNYVPFLQLRSHKHYVFDIYSLGRIFQIRLRTTNKQALMQSIESKVNKDILGTPLASNKAYAPVLIGLSKRIGLLETLPCQPYVGRGTIRLRAHKLQFKAAPQDMPSAGIGPNTSFEYDPTLLINKPPAVCDLVSAVALAAIPIMHMHRAMPYDVVLVSKEFAQFFWWAAPRLGLYALRAEDLGGLGCLLDRSQYRNWITVVKLKQGEGTAPLLGCVFATEQLAQMVWDAPVLLLHVPSLRAASLAEFKQLFYNVLCTLIEYGTPIEDVTVTPVLLVSKLFNVIAQKLNIKGNAFDYVSDYACSIVGKWDNINHFVSAIKWALSRVGYKGANKLPKDFCKDLIVNSLTMPSSVIDQLLDRFAASGLVEATSSKGETGSSNR